MATFLEAIGTAARSTYCFALGNFETGANALGNISPLADGIGRTAGALRAQLCNEPPTPIEPAPPFEGGQCDAVYIVTLARNFPDGTPRTPIVRVTRGPIAPVRQVPVQGNPGTVQFQLGSFSQVLSTSTCQGLSAGAFRYTTISSEPPEVDIRVQSVQICSGTDNCGDPTGPVPPPGNIFPPEVDVTYVDEGDNNITVPVNFVFAPVYVDLDGSLTVPVNVDVGGVNFTGNFTIAPEFNLNIRPAGNSPNPGQPDDPDAPGEPGDPADPIDPPEPDEPLIIGVLVFSDVSEDAAPTSILFDEGPNIYAPRLANVQFAIAVGGDVGWTSDLPVKSTQSYIPCPAVQGAVDVRVSPQPGVTVRFTPVRGQPLTDFT